MPLEALTDAIFISVSDGLGAGLILNGRVYRGHHGIAGEFGHMTIDEGGALCRCGNRGCLTTVVGGDALLETLRVSHRGLKLSDLVARAHAGDARFIRAIADTGRYLGLAAANLCNIFDPERVVVGGELARSGELLLGPMRHSLERSIIVGPEQLPEVVQGQLGERAELLGALALRHRPRADRNEQQRGDSDPGVTPPDLRHGLTAYPIPTESGAGMPR